MKAAEIHSMTLDQIDDEVLKLKKARFTLRFQKATGQLENTARARLARRDIARMKTIAAQKRAGSEPAVKAAPVAKAKDGGKSKPWDVSPTRSRAKAGGKPKSAKAKK